MTRLRVIKNIASIRGDWSCWLQYALDRWPDYSLVYFAFVIEKVWDLPVLAAIERWPPYSGDSLNRFHCTVYIWWKFSLCKIFGNFEKWMTLLEFLGQNFVLLKWSTWWQGICKIFVMKFGHLAYSWNFAPWNFALYGMYQVELIMSLANSVTETVLLNSVTVLLNLILKKVAVPSFSLYYWLFSCITMHYQEIFF